MTPLGEFHTCIVLIYPFVAPGLLLFRLSFKHALFRWEFRRVHYYYYSIEGHSIVFRSQLLQLHGWVAEGESSYASRGYQFAGGSICMLIPYEGGGGKIEACTSRDVIPRSLSLSAV